MRVANECRRFVPKGTPAIYFFMEIIYHSAVQSFLTTLEDRTLSKVMRAIDLLEEYGFRLRMPHTKYFGDGLYELRVHDAQEVRLFYGFAHHKIYLAHGFMKKTMRIPQKELIMAIRHLQALVR